MITWLQSPQNSPSLIQPPNPVLEPLWQPSLLPTNRISGLPEHGAQVGVVRVCASTPYIPAGFLTSAVPVPPGTLKT